ncbi:conserved hypothetical protein (DUF547) [Formosa agariphila KMM 3901]|uniref:DUF547 domain-containing protein n=1 Tax=Formosa agariphila (strain DSM 15362 / KCTC 12365 / LMG 23005 / KMM 3901 / M-2Alg 35-1) TaxID=1347342 RepID=T2KJE4_FORAG|nr:DUF547 domain-containing protein [Formosa agariphila]CDF78109.1 conserved hypothetical protein (DUF547) [Formosa agariphila KMM 3901]
MKHYLILLVCISFLTFSKGYGINTSQNSFTTYANSIPKDILPAVDHAQWSDLLSKHVTDEGNVDYKGFKSDEEALQAYLKILKENPPSEFWSEKEVLAYWINVYNAFTVRLILDNPSVKSIKDIKEPWDKKFILIGKKWYSLGDIEHNILRKMNEPRIHFAINCASYSCPILLNTAYTAERLDAQLEVASYRFVTDASKNAITKEAIQISKIFEWFAEDFEEQGGVISFLNTYSTVEIDADAEVTYKDYNWSLNN